MEYQRAKATPSRYRQRKKREALKKDKEIDELKRENSELRKRFQQSQAEVANLRSILANIQSIIAMSHSHSPSQGQNGGISSVAEAAAMPGKPPAGDA